MVFLLVSLSKTRIAFGYFPRPSVFGARRNSQRHSPYHPTVSCYPEGNLCFRHLFFCFFCASFDLFDPIFLLNFCVSSYLSPRKETSLSWSQPEFGSDPSSVSSSASQFSSLSFDFISSFSGTLSMFFSFFVSSLHILLV